MKTLDLSDIIIYEDDNYLIIDKPAPMSTLDDRNDSFNALSLVRRSYEAAQVCHRIDKETSGVLLFAKNNDAYKHAVSQFENRLVDKEYHAIIEGKVDIASRVVDVPLRMLGSGRGCVDPARGKEAVTEFTTIETFKKHTLMMCKPITGRTHQIRIHVSHHGTPIVSDKMYGGQPFYLSAIKKNYHQKSHREENPLIKRFALHAYQITFQDEKGVKIAAKAEYPKDFMILLKQLRRNT